MSFKNSQLQMGMMGDSQSEEDPSEEWIQRHEHSQQLIKNLKSKFQNDANKNLSTNHISEINNTKNQNNHTSNKRGKKNGENDVKEEMNGVTHKWHQLKPKVPPNKPTLHSYNGKIKDNKEQLKRGNEDNIFGLRSLYKPFTDAARKLSAVNHNLNVKNNQTENKVNHNITQKDNKNTWTSDHNSFKDWDSGKDDDDDEAIKLPSISELAKVFEGDRYKHSTNKKKLNIEDNITNQKLNTHYKSNAKMANTESCMDDVFKSNDASDKIPTRSDTVSLKVTSKIPTKLSTALSKRTSLSFAPRDPMKLKLDFTSVLKNLKHVSIKTEEDQKKDTFRSELKMEGEEENSLKDSFKSTSPNSHSTLYKSKIEFKKANTLNRKSSVADENKQFESENNDKRATGMIGKQKDKFSNWAVNIPNPKNFQSLIQGNKTNKKNFENNGKTYKNVNLLNKNVAKSTKNMSNKNYNEIDYESPTIRGRELDVQSAEFLNFCLKPTNLLSKLIQNDQYNYQTPNIINKDSSIDDSSVSFERNIFNGMLEKNKTQNNKYGKVSKTYKSNSKKSSNDKNTINDNINEQSNTNRDSDTTLHEESEENSEDMNGDSNLLSPQESIDTNEDSNSSEINISPVDPSVEAINNVDEPASIKRNSQNSRKDRKATKSHFPQPTHEFNNSNNPYRFYNGSLQHSTDVYHDYNNDKKDFSINEEKVGIMERDKRPKSQKINDELLKTEEGYVKKLAMLSNDLKGRVIASNLLTDAEVDKMFMNLTDILQFHQQQLLPAISESVRDINGGIGEVFSKLGPKLRMYSAYHSGFSQAINLMNQKISKNQAFQSLLLLIQSNESFNNLTAQHHMLAVIQRVPQYILILQRYLKEVDQKSPEYSATLNALNCLKNVAELNNTSTTHQSKGLSATFSPSSSAAHLVCSSCAKKVPSKHVLCHACQKFYCKSCFHWRPINKKLKKMDDERKQQKAKVKFCSDCLVEQEEAAERLRDDKLKVNEGKLKVKRSKNEWIEKTFLIDANGTFYMLENDGIPRLEKIPLDDAELILANQNPSSKNTDLHTFTLKWKSKTTKHFKAANQKEFDEWLASLYSLMDQKNKMSYSFKGSNESYDVRNHSISSFGSPDESET